jgi:hypothetical protein
MNVRLKGNKLILSEAPKRDVAGAFLILSTKLEHFEVIFDATTGQKEYELPNELTRKDIEAVYLRVL